MPTPDSINTNVLMFWELGEATPTSPRTMSDATLMKTCTGIVAFLGDIVTNGTIATDATLVTLPEGFRPGGRVVKYVNCVNMGGTNYSRPLFIESTGVCHIPSFQFNGTVCTRGLVFSILDSTYGAM